MNLLRLSISPLPAPAGWYALPLRLIIGFGFIQHGYAKLARGPDDFISVLHAMGLPAPFVLGWATIIVELVGGLMILAGKKGALTPEARGVSARYCHIRVHPKHHLSAALPCSPVVLRSSDRPIYFILAAERWMRLI
jgi:hypothetical protein